MTFRTQTAEKKYKVYKNQFITILRQAKKRDYSKMLRDNKSNIKGM